MSRRVLILNGPNLNLLGQREPEIYGRTTLAELDAACVAEAERLDLRAECHQSNHEGELVGWVQSWRDPADGLIVNAGAYSHSSIALLDALRAVPGPVIEVHLSNIFRREAFRHHSYISLAATGVICGLGTEGYLLALRAIGRLLDQAEAGQAGGAKDHAQA